MMTCRFVVEIRTYFCEKNGFQNEKIQLLLWTANFLNFKITETCFFDF